VLYISPDQRLTVLRTGMTGDEQQDALIAAVAELSALYPVR